MSHRLKDGCGAIGIRGTIPATSFNFDRWMSALQQPWRAAMAVATFTRWIYEHLEPRAAAPEDGGSDDLLEIV